MIRLGELVWIRQFALRWIGRCGRGACRHLKPDKSIELTYHLRALALQSLLQIGLLFREDLRLLSNGVRDALLGSALQLQFKLEYFPRKELVLVRQVAAACSQLLVLLLELLLSQQKLLADGAESLCVDVDWMMFRISVVLGPFVHNLPSAV